jgi:hypothetical protein
MAVVAVLLAMVVAAAATGGDGGGEAGIDPPTASFVFETDGSDVNVTLYGGDALDGEAIYVESASEGTLGNVAGTDGSACATNLTRMRVDDGCLVTNATHDTLYVVWRSGGDRYILDRRYGDPTPTPVPTATPSPTPTLTPTETPRPGTPTDGVGNGTTTPGNGTVTPVNGTATPGDGPTETPTDGTPVGETPAGETPTRTPGGGTPTPADAATPSATPTATPTRTPPPTESA